MTYKSPTTGQDVMTYSEFAAQYPQLSGDSDEAKQWNQNLMQWYKEYADPLDPTAVQNMEYDSHGHWVDPTSTIGFTQGAQQYDIQNRAAINRLAQLANPAAPGGGRIQNPIDLQAGIGMGSSAMAAGRVADQSGINGANLAILNRQGVGSVSAGAVNQRNSAMMPVISAIDEQTAKNIGDRARAIDYAQQDAIARSQADRLKMQADQEGSFNWGSLLGSAGTGALTGAVIGGPIGAAVGGVVGGGANLIAQDWTSDAADAKKQRWSTGGAGGPQLGTTNNGWKI